MKYFLFTIDEVLEVAKDPQEMLETLGVASVPMFYKVQYFQLVLNENLNELLNGGLLEGDPVPEEAMKGGFLLKDLMGDYITKHLGEDALNILKAELEDAWNERFGEHNYTQELLDEVDNYFNNLGVNFDDKPQQMFP